MIWQQLVVYLDQSDVELFSELLTQVGALSVTFQQDGGEGIVEPLPGETPLWSHVQVIGLFAEDRQTQQIISRIKAAWSPRALPAYRWLPLADQDWERAWLDDFQPMQFGDRLWVIPSVYEPIDPQAINICLDPGLAFGTGTHATTALCLEWLEANVLPGSQVLDFGCGSGILSIAAAKLGAGSVHCVDIDPQALQATQSNALANNVDDKLMLELPGPESVDLLVANIVVNPLIELATDFASYIRPNGSILLSGILTSQVQQVCEVYEPWTALQLSTERDDWCLLVGKKF